MGNDMTSEEFKGLRVRLGMTQAELAREIGMQQQSINKIETTRTPTAIQSAFIHLIAKNKGEKNGSEN
jgi:DNA-binding XRE family transcriptional regulator